jgi:hypothetical protein
MDVPEGDDELHRQREQRQPAAESLVRPEPPHHANSGLIAHSRRRRSVYDAAAGAQRHNNFPQAGPERLMRAVALMRQSQGNKRNRCAGPMPGTNATPVHYANLPFPICPVIVML